MILFTAPQQQVIVQDSKILQHMSATGMVSRVCTNQICIIIIIIVWGFVLMINSLQLYLSVLENKK